MSDIEDFDLDSPSFDDAEMGFDDLSMDTEPVLDNRDPVANLKNNFFKGALSKASDSNFIEEKLKDEVPAGYRVSYENAQKGFDELEKAKRNVLAPVMKELPTLKQNLNRLTPIVKRLTGERFGNRFDEITKVKSSADIQGDADEQEITSTMTGIFGTWRESQLDDRRQDLIDKFVRERSDERRFELQYTALLDISNLLNRMAGYNDQVTSKIQEKSLELDYKKYHILRNLLKVTTEGYNTSIGELKAITKNTALPDLVKRENYENFQQLFLDEWQGRTTANIVDHAQNYFMNMGKNLQAKAKETGEKIAEGMSGIGSAAEAYAEMDEMQRELGGGGEQQNFRQMAQNMAGSTLGSKFSDKVVSRLAEGLGKFLRKNDKASQLNDRLAYGNYNMAAIADQWITDNLESDGMKGKFFEFLDELRPSIKDDRESITHTLDAKLTNEARFDRMTRESVVKIIPGWLAKIYHQLKIMTTGNKNAEEEVFDIYSEDFTEKSEALKRLEQRIVSDTEVTEVRKAMTDLVQELFKGNEEALEKLTNKQIELLENGLLRSANNDLGLTPKKLRAGYTYKDLPGAVDSDVEAITEAMSTALSDGDDVYGRYRKAASSFRALQNINPETQTTFNLLNASGNNMLLREMGYGNVKDGKLKLDFDKLYSRKLGYTSLVEDDLKKPFSPFNPNMGQGGGTVTPITPNIDLGGVESALGLMRNDLINALSTTDVGSERYDILADKLDAINSTLQISRDIDLSEATVTKLMDGVKEAFGIDERTATQDSTGGWQDLSAEVIDELVMANSTLDDVRTVLTEMYAGQQANHSELMGRDSFANMAMNMGLKVSNALKSPFKMLQGGWRVANKFVSKMWAAGTDVITGTFKNGLGFVKGLGDEVVNTFITPDDVYFRGEAEPVLLGRDIKSGDYRLVKPNGANGKVIRNINDITGAVRNVKTNNLVITKEEFDRRGVETRNPKLSVKLGGAFAKVAKAPITLASKGLGAGRDVLNWGAKKASNVATWATDKLNAAKSIYDSKGELLISKADMERGLYYKLVDGKKVIVNTIKDIDDTIYHLNTDEPVITKDSLKSIVDKFGKPIKTRSLLGYAADKVVDGAKLVGRIVKAPFSLASKGVKALTKIFEEKLIKSLLIHVPDNVIFRANVVNLYTEMTNIHSEGAVKTSGGFSKSKGSVDLDSDELDAREKRGDESFYQRTKRNFNEMKEDIASSETYQKAKTKAEEVKDTANDKAKRDEFVENLGNRFAELRNEAEGKLKSSSAVSSLTESIESLKERTDKTDSMSAKLREAIQGLTKATEENIDTFQSERQADEARNRVMGKWNEQIRRVKGDTDGDGVRDGSWQAQLKSQAEKARERVTQHVNAKPEKEDSGRWSGLLSGLSVLAAPLMAGITKLASWNFVDLFKDLGTKVLSLKAMSTATDALSDGLDGFGDGEGKDKKGSKKGRKGGVKGGKGKAGLLSRLGTFAAETFDKTKGLFGKGAATATAEKTIAKGVVKTAAVKAGTKLAVGGAAAGLAAAGFATLAPAIGIAATLWTAYEIGSGLFGYFDRRSETKRIEYLRMMQYGYYVGSDGDFEERKVALRYFESEMLGRMETSNGSVSIAGSPDTLWEEYAEDFYSTVGDEAARAEWLEWFKYRFTPVFYRWIATTAALSTNTKRYKMEDLDDIAHKIDLNKFTSAVLNFPETNYDPLNRTNSCFTKVGIQVKRTQVEKFANDFITNAKLGGIVDVKGNKVDEEKAKAATNAHKANHAEANKNNKTTPVYGKGFYGAGTGEPSKYQYGAAASAWGYNQAQKNQGKTQYTNRVDLEPLDMSKVSGVAEHKVTDKIEERIAKYNGYIKEASQKTGVDEHLIRSIIRQESAGIPTAKSYVGASGLMQLMPATAKEVGVSNTEDPKQSIMGGTEYIRRQLKYYKGNTELALAAYNAGAGNVNKAIKKAGSREPEAVLNALPQVTGKHSKETQQYVVKITNNYRDRLGIGGKSVYDKEGNSVDLSTLGTKTPEATKEVAAVSAKVEEPVTLPVQKEINPFSSGEGDEASLSSANVSVADDTDENNADKLPKQEETPTQVANRDPATQRKIEKARQRAEEMKQRALENGTYTEQVTRQDTIAPAVYKAEKSLRERELAQQMALVNARMITPETINSEPEKVENVPNRNPATERKLEAMRKRNEEMRARGQSEAKVTQTVVREPILTPEPPKVSREAETVLNRQAEARRRTSEAMTQHSANVNEFNHQLLQVNTDQLNELRKLNRNIEVVLTGKKSEVQETPNEVAKEQPTSVAEAKPQPTKRFQRKVVETKPTISLERKII